MSGKEGNEFTTQALEIAGYHLISESKLVHGIFGKTLEITFVYEKIVQILQRIQTKLIRTIITVRKVK